MGMHGGCRKSWPTELKQMLIKTIPLRGYMVGWSDDVEDDDSDDSFLFDFIFLFGPTLRFQSLFVVRVKLLKGILGVN